jgi:hypothetical protein
MAVLLFSLPRSFGQEMQKKLEMGDKSVSFKVCLIKDATSEPEVLRFVIDRDLSSSLSYLVCLYMKRTVFATNASSKDKCAGDFTRLLNINRGI